MPRGRARKPDLTESWDDVDQDFGNDIYTKDDEQKELGSQYKSSQDTHEFSSDDERLVRSRTPRAVKKSVRMEEPEPQLRKRAVKEPELIMPSSPDGATSKLRAQTPHFRLNQRSLTSDAGFIQRKLAEEESNWTLQPVLSWILSVLSMAINNHLVKGFVALWLVIGVGILLRNFATQSINNALSPICRFPGTSFLPFCESYHRPEVTGNAEFDKLMQAQAQFQEVLTSSTNGAVLPLDMKRSEASIRDLRQVVQYSSIPSRNELVFEFGGFIDTARQASQDLSRFNTRIGNAVDRILSTNRWTLQVIEGVAAKDSLQGSFSRFFSDNLNIFAPFQPVALSRDVLMDQYLRHTNAVEEQVLNLISEAQVLLGVLDNLDGRLDVIAGIATRDGISVEENKEALFATLWTKLGGNRNSVAKLDFQLNLLREVGQYRRLAWAHVAGTIVKLQAIRDQLEDLRERVAQPEVLGSKVPLEVHIENINLGIERLEIERDATKRTIDENTARVIDRGGRNERLIEARSVKAR